MVLKNISPGCGVRASLMLCFDPETSTTGLSSGVTVGGTGSSLVQTTGVAAVVSEAASNSATCPVECPGTDVSQQNATQPVEAPGAGTATQPVEAPGAGPEVLPSGTGTAALQSDCEEDLQMSLVLMWMTTSGTAPQTEISPGMRMLIRNSLRRLVTERPAEA